MQTDHDQADHFDAEKRRDDLPSLQIDRVLRGKYYKGQDIRMS
jgi:hypothetical protein